MSCVAPDRSLGGGSDGGSDGSKRLRVATALPPLETVVRAIGGERVEAFALLGPSDSPAGFQISDALVSRLAGASIYFRSGVPFERGAVFRAISEIETLEVVELVSGHDPSDTARSRERGPEADGSGHGPPGEGHVHDGRDPHLWLSPTALEGLAEVVGETLCRVDPEGCGDYEARRLAWLAEVRAVDRRVADRLAPLAGRSFFVYHPSWGHFAEHYGLVQIAVEREGKAPSDAELAALVPQVEATKARHLYTQPQIGGSSAAAAAGVLGLEIEVADPLRADLLENLESFARRLEAEAAEGAG